ncbi:MAG: hypothetical protein ACK4WH_06980 [Phycisphaerales bacterium]
MPIQGRKYPQVSVGNDFARQGPTHDLPTGAHLESEILSVGASLLRAVESLVHTVVKPGAGPVALARALGLDKVLASRVLKAIRQQDPVASIFFMPGPEPLRAMVRAADRRGSPKRAVEAAAAAVADFERLIDVQIGDRSLLDSILSAWIPDARAEFELRRKQAAFKALSQLRGVQADAVMATCVLAPSQQQGLMDVVWVHGLTGLHRVRPGVVVKIASRRMSSEPSARRAARLDGRTIDDDAPPLLDEFCSDPTPEVRVHRVKDSMFYTLGGNGFGAGSAVDVMFAEVNRAELKHPSVLAAASRKPGSAGDRRGAYFFSETVVPAKSLQFDLVVEESLFGTQEPMLRLYDTAFEGVADAFDPRRDLDRLDMLESIVPLGRGLTGVRSGVAPRYQELMHRVMREVGCDPARFTTYRCAISYPLYGSQTAMVFPTPG